MIIAISGTPGTGKHTLARELSKITGYTILDIGSILAGKEEVSLRELNLIFNKAKTDNLIVVSHMSHLINSRDISLVIDLRTDPEILEHRLRLTNYSDSKIYDTVLFEAIDGTYIEALQTGKKTLQIDNRG
ncbi:MAG: putative kinase, partial [Candidatus Parvarchaeum acidophilus ARMAN-5]